jgi:hypothetical protein
VTEEVEVEEAKLFTNWNVKRLEERRNWTRPGIASIALALAAGQSGGQQAGA